MSFSPQGQVHTRRFASPLSPAWTLVVCALLAGPGCGAPPEDEAVEAATDLPRDRAPTPGPAELGPDAIGEPSYDADRRRVATLAGSPGATRVEVRERTDDGSWGAPRVLEREGAPDRLALSGDGRWVAWFSGRSGIASLWAVPFEGGDPVQLTNVGLRSGTGGPPPGFVAPPVSDPPRFEGDVVTWKGPEGRTTRVELPR